MDYLALKNELLTDPATLGYATFLPSSTGKVAELLNAKNFTKAKSRMVTARAILAECADGAAILDALEAAVAVNSAVKWAVKFLGQDAGIDVGHAATRTMIDQLVTATVLTLSQADQLKNMANQPASRAEVLGFTSVDSVDVQKALES